MIKIVERRLSERKLRMINYYKIQDKVGVIMRKITAVARRKEL